MSGELSFGKLFKSIPRGSSSSNINIGLTTLGTSKAEHSEGQDLHFRILADLQDNGSSSPSEIANRLNVDIHKVKHAIYGKDNGLLKKQYVRQMQGEE